MTERSMNKKLLLVVAFLLGPIYFIVALIQLYLTLSGKTTYLPGLQLINSLLSVLGPFAYTYLATLMLAIYLLIAYIDAKRHPTL